MQTAVRTLGHFIGGADTAGSSERFGDVYDPAAGELQARVAFASPQEVNAAAAAGRRAVRVPRGARREP
jgi:malonate-semialdehyde dehydrogenase (acetylating)/methylmalonate-semialdehyde dehydrogenase